MVRWGEKLLPSKHGIKGGYNYGTVPIANVRLIERAALLGLGPL